MLRVVRESDIHIAGSKLHAARRASCLSQMEDGAAYGTPRVHSNTSSQVKDIANGSKTELPRIICLNSPRLVRGSCLNELRPVADEQHDEPRL